MTAPKPSQTEEEYFARIEAEKLKRRALEAQQKFSQKQREEIKALHWMRCPKCGMELNSVPYKGVVLDKCFQCLGVFLDDGELEKIAGKEGGFLTGVMSLFRT